MLFASILFAQVVVFAQIVPTSLQQVLPMLVSPEGKVAAAGVLWLVVLAGKRWSLEIAALLADPWMKRALTGVLAALPVVAIGLTGAVPWRELILTGVVAALPYWIDTPTKARSEEKPPAAAPLPRDQL